MAFPASSTIAPAPGCGIARLRAHVARAARAIPAASIALAALLVLASAGTARAQAVAAPFSQTNVPLASLASEVSYTVDFSTLPLRPNLIAEAVPDAAHPNMELELKITNCNLDPSPVYFCPATVVSTPNAGAQSLVFDFVPCGGVDITPPLYQGKSCDVKVRALNFGSGGAPATFDIVIRSETVVPSSTISADVTTNLQTTTISPAKDTTLYQANTSSSNGQGESFWSSLGTGANALHSLLFFNIASNVPAGVTITGARLELQVLSTAGTPAFQLHAVPRNASVVWTEGNANAAADESTPPVALNNAASWSHRNWFASGAATGPWSTPGGDRVQPPIESVSVTQTGLLTLNSPALLSHVQAMYANGATSDGLLLVPISGSVRFGSAEHATLSLRPVLKVDYFQSTYTGPTNIPTTTVQFFDEGQNFRWIYDLDDDKVLVTPILGRCAWTPPGGFLISMPYSYQYQGNPSYQGLDCCTWQIGTQTGVTGTGQALFYINVDSSNPANQPADTDIDGIKNLCDNCPTVPNGPLFGTCTAGPRTNSTCRSNQECLNFPCSLSQDDVDRNGTGDACVPEPGLGAMLGAGLAGLVALGRRRERMRA